jgi:iron complex transport system permease protein
MRTTKYWLNASIAIAVLCCLVVTAVGLGSVWIAPSKTIAVLLQHFINRHSNVPTSIGFIIWNMRMPRVAAALLIGAMLSVAGATLQGLVRNPLADPYIIGVSSGASAGAAAVMVLGSAAFLNLSISAAAFVGALLCVFIAYFFAQKYGYFSDIRIVLAGVAVSYVAMAITSYLELTSNPGALKGLLFWTMGSVAGVNFSNLFFPLLIFLICFIWLMGKAKVLNALALGDDYAIGVGVNIRRVRLGLLVASSALTALAVCVAGGVGFVGLIIPHIVRLRFGSDYKILLPFSALYGAVFLVLIDLLSRTIATPNEYPLTIFTAMFGGPFFLWLMSQNKVE